MKLFRPAGLLQARDTDTNWTVTHGYARKSEFLFPDIYLAEDVEALCAQTPEAAQLLEGCLYKFVNHDYGDLTSLQGTDNLSQRLLKFSNRWLCAIWPTEYGKLYFDVLYDLAVFYLGEESQRELTASQRQRERDAENH